MREAVARDLVLAGDLARELRIDCRPLARNEEGRSHALVAQRCKDFGNGTPEAPQSKGSAIDATSGVTAGKVAS
jgi:hypothetical protein